MSKIGLLIFFVLFFSIKSEKRVCRNQKGDEVDWFLIFLIPLKETENKLSYYYIDNKTNKLKFFEHTDDTFPPNTLTRYALSNETNFNYFFWNDDNKTKDEIEKNLRATKHSSTYYAHSKGGIVYDNETGAILITSLPRYPTRDSENNLYIEMPDNTGVYAQTFFCISATKNTSEKVIELLNYIGVSSNKCVEKDRVNYNPNMWVERLIRNDYDYDDYPIYLQTYISSLNGKKINVITKSKRRDITPFDEDINLIYKDDFYVRTWSKPSLAEPICSTYKILNVLNITIGDYDINKNKEHSKWAVSANLNIACISDLNHVDSQAKRGGNIFCFKDKNISDLMKGFVKVHDVCNQDIIGC
jgi:hypothetical protein